MHGIPSCGSRFENQNSLPKLMTIVPVSLEFVGLDPGQLVIFSLNVTLSPAYVDRIDDGFEYSACIFRKYGVPASAPREWNTPEACTRFASYMRQTVSSMISSAGTIPLLPNMLQTARECRYRAMRHVAE
jgi:hypothetical protein